MSDNEAFETKLLALIDAGIQAAFREAEDEIGASDIFDEIVDTIRADGILSRASQVAQPAQNERDAFESWNLAGCEIVDDPASGRMDIARHCAWSAWKARATFTQPA